jgi:hypothetical protein
MTEVVVEVVLGGLLASHANLADFFLDGFQLNIKG